MDNLLSALLCFGESDLDKCDLVQGGKQGIP